MTAAALADDQTEFTGDEQIQRRPVGPLLDALRELGATARALRDNGCAPLVVGGPLRGGHVTVQCHSSQYLSSLLLGCPLAPDDTVIEVPLLNESPYVRLTMDWLEREGISFEAADDLSRFELPGGQDYSAFERAIPADFSSATFFLVAAAVTGSALVLQGLDMEDAQGDKCVVGMLEQMGCRVLEAEDGLEVTGPETLQRASFDLNATPDALPSLAVAGCFAEGRTELLNVPQARDKETDRLAVMTRELSKMGGQVEELGDGLVVRHSPLRGAHVDGHGDHRVVMALAVAGLAAEGQTVVEGAEAAAVTFPSFVDLMQSVGARMHPVC
jgi:3-phosphoshikimate 1-carboxyvinyltransferase